ncbi:MAG: hypothetical protein GSR86_03035 [Desulfurococcales archaeon]|nr:hypothetical protein [Desulfurococcales archaeon]
MGTVKLDFTYEAWRGCRDKPSVRLVSTIMDVEPGGVIEIVGEDSVMPLNLILDTLEDECFDYDVEERDDIVGTYRVRAVKRQGCS